MVTVFSPGTGDHSGSHGVGFIVDVALDARKARFNHLLSPTALLSTTPNKPGTPFHGSNTNLAGLFQINGVAKVQGKDETRDTWQPGKPIFGTGNTTLIVYAVAGTAPAVLPAGAIKKISNVVRVRFTIAR